MVECLVAMCETWLWLPAVFLDDLSEGKMVYSLECTQMILEFP